VSFWPLCVFDFFVVIAPHEIERHPEC
jgi:hypothetical protein